MRAVLYRVFAEAFEYPDDEWTETIRSGLLSDRLRELLAIGDPECASEAEWARLTEAGEDDDLAVEYTRLFDVGSSGPPCPLYGGEYSGGRMRTMEETVRFYNHFGLTMSESPHELPDHLVAQLEFLHYLAYREAEALEAGADAEPFERAERDFLVRHPGRWVPELAERLAANECMPFFEELTRRLAGFLEADTKRLVERVGTGPTAAEVPSSACMARAACPGETPSS